MAVGFQRAAQKENFWVYISFLSYNLLLINSLIYNIRRRKCEVDTKGKEEAAELSAIYFGTSYYNYNIIIPPTTH